MAEECRTCHHPLDRHSSSHGRLNELDRCAGAANPVHPGQCLCRAYVEDESKLEEPQDSIAKLARRIGILEFTVRQIDRKIDDILMRLPTAR
jgi:hypothetical protein